MRIDDPASVAGSERVLVQVGDSAERGVSHVQREEGRPLQNVGKSASVGAKSATKAAGGVGECPGPTFQTRGLVELLWCWWKEMLGRNVGAEWGSKLVLIGDR